MDVIQASVPVELIQANLTGHWHSQSFFSFHHMDHIRNPCHDKLAALPPFSAHFCRSQDGDW